MDNNPDKLLVPFLIKGRKYKVTQQYAHHRRMQQLEEQQQLENEQREREQNQLGIPSPESSSSRRTGRRRRRSEHATQTHIRQSSMYSDRPRRSQGRRAEPQTNLPAEEATAEGSTNELSPTIADISNLKRLSLNDSSPTLDPSDGVGIAFAMDHNPDNELIPFFIGGREYKATRSYARRHSTSREQHVKEQHEREPSPLRRFGIPSPESSSSRRTGDVVHTGDMGSGLPDSTILVPPPYVEALSPRLEKYLKEHLVDSFEDAAVAQEQGTPAAAQHSKYSKEDIAKNGKKWMTQEVKVAFEKYMEGKDHLKGHMYEFDELQHQCLSVENYYKIFHHFNFTMKLRAPGSTEWTTMLFFAELKEILRQKMYFCCPLEPYENGHCYACKNQGMDDLKHPVIGAFDRGSPDTVFPYMYESDSSDEFVSVRLEDEAEDESYVFDDERRYY